MVRFVFRQFDGDFIIGLRNIFFKINTSLYDSQPAADIF